mgnify:CR=1 FL=1|jgi:hypothetical protein
MFGRLDADADGNDRELTTMFTTTDDVGTSDRRDTADDDDDGDVESAETSTPARVPLGGINEDGYFGDADGAWVPSDRVSLVLMQRERERERTTDAIEDFKVVFERFGWPIAASAFCVFLIVFAIEVFNGRKHEPSGTP